MPIEHPDRRQFIASVAGGSLLGPVGLAAGRPGGKSQFKGITYDTKTHEPLGGVSATLLQDNEELRGTLAINGRKLPLVMSRNKDTKHTSEYRTRIGGKHSLGRLPLVTKIVIDANHQWMTGYLTYPSPQFSKLGFTLVQKSKKKSKDLTKGLHPVSTHPAYGSPQRLRDIPTASAIGFSGDASRGDKA